MHTYIHIPESTYKSSAMYHMLTKNIKNTRYTTSMYRNVMRSERKSKTTGRQVVAKDLGRGGGGRGYIHGLGPSTPYHQAELPGQTKIRTRALTFDYMKMDVPGAGIMR